MSLASEFKTGDPQTIVLSKSFEGRSFHQFEILYLRQLEQ